MSDPIFRAFKRETEATTTQALRVKRRVQRNLRDGPDARTSGLSFRARWLPWSLGLCASVAAILVVLRLDVPAVPVYVADSLQGGVAPRRGLRPDENEPVVFYPSSLIRWSVRPERRVVHAFRDQRAVLFAETPQGVRLVLEEDVAPSKSGAYVIRVPAAQYFSDQFGAWTLRLLIGRRASIDRVPSEDAFEASTGHQVFEAKCVYSTLGRDQR